MPLRSRSRETALEAAGLSPRAVSVAQSFDATTVGELLGVPLYKIAKARGAGAVIRKEINRRHKQWAPSSPSHAARGGRRDPSRSTTWPQLLTPSGRKGSRKPDVARLTLALPGADAFFRPGRRRPRSPDGSASPRPRSRGISRAFTRIGPAHVARSAAGGARGSRDRGRPDRTVQELATSLRARHGSADSDPDRALAAAAAIVRAAVEAETWAGLNAEDETISERGPRLAVMRRGDAPRRARVAARYRRAERGRARRLRSELGRRADSRDGVADARPRHCGRELRAVAPPDGMAPLADTRLVALASAASRGALVSPRLELYPRGFDLVTALRAAQAGAGVRHKVGITVEDLLGRVRSRFPEVIVPNGLTHVGMQEALREAGFTLEFDVDRARFVPPSVPMASRSLTSGSSTTLAHVYIGGLTRTSR